MEIFDKNGEIIRKRLKSINDRFKKDRGGSSEFLDLYCSSCDAYIGTYQKDGSGNLFRLYVDRLITPYKQYSGPFEGVDDMPQLECPNPACESEMGVPMVYTKENRLAYRIIASIHKTKNHSGKFPPADVEKDDLYLNLDDLESYVRPSNILTT